MPEPDVNCTAVLQQGIDHDTVLLAMVVDAYVSQRWSVGLSIMPCLLALFFFLHKLYHSSERSLSASEVHPARVTTGRRVWAWNENTIFAAGWRLVLCRRLVLSKIDQRHGRERRCLPSLKKELQKFDFFSADNGLCSIIMRTRAAHREKHVRMTSYCGDFAGKSLSWALCLVCRGKPKHE